jgi:hypothetical protein
LELLWSGTLVGRNLAIDKFFKARIVNFFLQRLDVVEVRKACIYSFYGSIDGLYGTFVFIHKCNV